MIRAIVFNLVWFVLPLAVIAGSASALSTAREEDERDGDADEGIGTVRRLFIYVLAFVGVVFAAVGVSMLIGGVIDAVTGEALILDRRQSLAIALAFTVVGTPAALLFMLLAQRSIRAHELERRSQARRLYLAVTRSVALVMVAWNTVNAARMILGLEPVEGGPWGALLAWGAVWAIHERLAVAEPAPTRMTRLLDRLALYFGALLGLLMLLQGMIGVVAAPLSAAYDRMTNASLLAVGGDNGLRAAIVPCLVGGAIWAWYWWRQLAQRDRLTTLWRVHVFLFGTLLAAALTIVPAATALYLVAEWFAGTPGSDTAAAHFAGMPVALATLVTGVATWGYHRAVIVEAGDAGRHSGPERVYRYLLSAAGLLATAIGVATLIALGAEGLGSAGGAFVTGADWWRNQLLRGIVEVVVGAPIWALHWGATQQALRDGRDERGAPSRRVYVFGTVGAAILALLVSLTIVLYQVFEAVLANNISLALLRDGDWALGVAITAGAIAYYQFLVLREDQAALPATDATTRARARQVVLLAPAGAEAIVEALERVEGVRVRAWRRLDGAATTAALSDERRAALVAAVTATDAERVLIAVSDDDFDVVPYAEDAR